MIHARRFRIILLALALLAIVGAAILASRYRHDLSQAQARIANSSLAQTACGPIEYASAGSGAPVLVVHGAGGGFDQGMDFGGDLVAHGFRVIAMSRFGYLRTPLSKDASAQAQADAHACLLDTLGIDRAAIIGASAGAPSALQFAIRHPDRCAGLALLVPALFVPRADNAPSVTTPPFTQALFDTALRFDFLFWLAPRITRDTMIEAILATPAEVVEAASANEQARVNKMVEHILPVSPRRLGLLNDAAITSNVPRYDLESVRVRTLAIGFADDRFGTYDAARYTAQHIPNARFLGYERGGHVWVGHHEEIVKAIAEFLR